MFWFLMLLSVPVATILALVLAQADIPPGIMALVPAIVIAIDLVVARTSWGKQFGKRNITAVTSLPLAVAAVVLMKITLPSWPAYAGDVAAFLAAVQACLLAWYGIWLAFWKTQQTVYDILQGQSATPDGHAG